MLTGSCLQSSNERRNLFSEQKGFLNLALTWTAQPNSSSRSFLISSRLCSVECLYSHLFFIKVTVWDKTYLIRAAGAAGMDLRGNEHELVNLGQSINLTSRSSYQADGVQLNLKRLQNELEKFLCEEKNMFLKPEKLQL